MLENLLSNAVKYGRDGGHIEVRLKKDNGIVLSVKDDGIGIKEEDLSKIWGRFYARTNPAAAKADSAWVSRSSAR